MVCRIGPSRIVWASPAFCKPNERKKAMRKWDVEAGDILFVEQRGRCRNRGMGKVGPIERAIENECDEVDFLLAEAWTVASLVD